MRLIQGRKLKLLKVCISGVLCIVHCPQVTRKAIIKFTSDTDYKIYFWPSSAISFIKPSCEVEVRDSRTGYLVPGHVGPGLRQMSRVVGTSSPSLGN